MRRSLTRVVRRSRSPLPRIKRYRSPLPRIKRSRSPLPRIKRSRSPPRKRSRSPSRKVSRERSFSISPSPPSVSDRKLNLMRHARERSIGRRRSSSKSRESSRHKRESPVNEHAPALKERKHCKHHRKQPEKLNVEENCLDKTEIIIQTNAPPLEEAFMDPSTCGFQATFKEKSPELVVEPNDIGKDISMFKSGSTKCANMFKTTFECVGKVKKSNTPKSTHTGNRKNTPQPNFNYMKVDDSIECQGNKDVNPIKSEHHNQSNIKPKSRGPTQVSGSKDNVKSGSKQKNKIQKPNKTDEEDRISRLEKLVEVLVGNSIKQQQEQTANLKEKSPVADFDDVPVPVVQQKVSPRSIPELIPSNSRFTTSMWLNRIHEVCLENELDEKTSIEFVERKMTGIVKAWFKSVAPCDFTWPELRLLIVKIFPDNLEFAATLKLLVNRIKESTETIKQYYFSKMYLCECCKITGENAVSCLIDGLNNPFTKQEIKSYNFSTPEALYSDYLTKYPDDIIEEQEKPLPMENREVVEEPYDPEQFLAEDKDYRMPPAPPPFRIKKICFTCKKFGHVAADCRHAPICYKCNKPGHIKAQCKASVDQVMCLSEKNDASFLSVNVDCELNGTRLKAFVDSGSSVVTITQSVAQQMGLLLDSTRRVLLGYGGGTVKAIGEVTVQLKVDQVKADVLAVVVPDLVQTSSVVLGRSFLNRDGAVMVLHKNKVRLLSKQERNGKLRRVFLNH